jgi:hypothetical protein
MVNGTDCSAFRNRAGMEVAEKGKNCRKCARDEFSVPERTVCKEESSDNDVKGRDVVTEIAKY